MSTGGQTPREVPQFGSERVSSPRSIVFDRAAEIYDGTRSLLPQTTETVTKLLASEIGGRGPCLEIGVGTGRIAVPLASAGVDVFGVDLSAPMLEKLRVKDPRLPVAIADATRLPFPDGSLRAALACHVLHLIPDWKTAAAELVRVTSPGGVVLIDGGSGSGFTVELQDRFAAAAGMKRTRVGLQDVGDLDSELVSLGTRPRALPKIEETRMLAPVVFLAALEANIFSVSWSLDDETRRRAAETTREWARSSMGDLSEPRELVIEILWRAYDVI